MSNPNQHRRWDFRSIIIVSFMLLGAFAAPCGAAGPEANYRIKATDLIEISVHQEPDLSGKKRVSKDGTAKLHLLESAVKLGGLTVEQASRKIRALYADGYLKNPQVTVTVLEYAKRKVTVLGQVTKPGTYALPANGSMTFMEAIGNAQGFTRLANRSAVLLKRVVNGRQVVYKINARKMLQSGAKAVVIRDGDVIQVNESTF